MPSYPIKPLHIFKYHLLARQKKGLVLFWILPLITLYFLFVSMQLSLPVLRKYFFVLYFFGFFVLFQTHAYPFFGKLAFLALFLALLLRPGAAVFGQMFPWLARLVPFRKQFGILAATLGFAHGVGFMLDTQSSWDFFTSPFLWSPSGTLLYGFCAFVVSLFPWLTSNLFSQKLLGPRWKKIQQLSYLFLVLVAVHVAMIHPSWMSFVRRGVIVAAWALVWWMASKKMTTQTHPRMALLSSVLVALGTVAIL